MRPDTVNSPEFDDPVLVTFDRIPKFIIRLTSDDGLVGIGETGRGCPQEHVEQGLQAVLGKDPTKMGLFRLPVPRNAAYAALEMAIFDLVGKVWGLPACKLLGGMAQSRVPVHYWTGRRTPEDLEPIRKPKVVRTLRVRERLAERACYIFRIGT